MRPSTFRTVQFGLPTHRSVLYEELGAEGAPKSGFGVVYGEQGNRLAVLREHITAKGLAVGMKAVAFLGKCGITAAPHFPFVGPGNSELLLVQYLEGLTLDAGDTATSTEAVYAHAVRLGKYFIRAYSEGERVLNDIIAPYQYVVHDGEPKLIDLAMYVRSNLLTLDVLGCCLDDVTHEYQPLLSGCEYDDLSAELNRAYQQCMP